MQFLHVARGSPSELETQLQLAEKIGYLAPNEELHSTLKSLNQLINGLIRSLKGTDHP